MEIFIEECSDLVTQYDTYLQMASARKEYDLTLINEIFRITHTIKADATMMLFECVAVPARAFERLLYFYRDECSIVNYDEFTGMLSKMIDYVKAEVQDILDGNADEGDGDALKQEFLDYRDKLASTLSVEKVETVEQTAKFEIQDEPMRFYIGSANDATKTPENIASERKQVSVRKTAKPAETVETGQNPEKDGKPEKTTQPAKPSDGPDKEKAGITWLKDNSSITVEDLENLYDLAAELSVVEERLMGRIGADFNRFADVMGEFHEVSDSIMHWVTKASNVPMSHISPKLTRTVEEMNSRLGRNISIVIRGEEVTVDRNWMDKLSGALVHLIRNSVDHGIETKEKRIKLGKPAEGVINVNYAVTEKEFVLDFSDDGAGIDTQGLKQKALLRGIPEAEFVETPEEIMELMFIPGVSTHDKEGVYSGRGVGMDVVKHNIEDLGGFISVKSEPGQGTTFTITIPLNTDDGEEMSGYEDFDSRR